MINKYNDWQNKNKHSGTLLLYMRTVSQKALGKCKQDGGRCNHVFSLIFRLLVSVGYRYTPYALYLLLVTLVETYNRVRMPVLKERERKTKDQLKAVFAYIRRKRDKEQQALAEIRAREEEEKKRKREEEKKKETVEDVKKEIEKCEAKLEELKQEKHRLFQQFKRVLNEEETKRQQEREAATLAAQHHHPSMHMHGTKAFGHHIPGQLEQKKQPGTPTGPGRV